MPEFELKKASNGQGLIQNIESAYTLNNKSTHKYEMDITG
jgi:hypothetical protein